MIKKALLILSLALLNCTTNTDKGQKNTSNTTPKERITTKPETISKEKAQLIGVWKNEVSKLSFEFTVKDTAVHYTFTSPKRTIENIAKITTNNDVTLYGFEWSEYAGGAIDDGSEDVATKKEPPLPTELGFNINFHDNEFMIQNYGNAMNYFVIIEEASEKYVIFKKE